MVAAVLQKAGCRDGADYGFAEPRSNQTVSFSAKRQYRHELNIIVNKVVSFDVCRVVVVLELHDSHALANITIRI
jgi:hypothetical protein